MATANTQQLLAPATLCLALACAAATAGQPEVVWVDNESFGLSTCANSDALPGSDDPQALMRALRERGLADAGQAVHLRGLVASSVTLTPISATWRCDGASSSVVYRLSTFDRASGQAWTSHLVSRLPTTTSTPVASSR